MQPPQVTREPDARRAVEDALRGHDVAVHDVAIHGSGLVTSVEP